MRPAPWRPWAVRLARFEAFEPRILLAADPVANIVADYFVETPSLGDVQSLAASTADMTGLAHVRNAYGLTGQGQTVAVIDTGIAYTHTALGGGYGPGYRVVGGYDFAENDANPYDDGPNGSHGTHVAGIIGSSNALTPGVATGVDLVALRVFDDQGGSSFTWVEQALQWVHDHRNSFRYPITTVNLSLGMDYNGLTPPANANLEAELAQLNADGIFIAAAAGNNFTTYVVPGVTYPAASAFVVPVSSVDDNGSLSSFSQRDSQTIAAPGRSVLSTVPDYMGNHNGIDDDFARYSGTSMAAPYVAGAAVLLRQAYQRVGITSVTQGMLYQEMVNTADTIHDAATGADYFRLNIGRAVDAVLSQSTVARQESTPGLYDPTSGLFYLRNSASTGIANATFAIGPARSGVVAIAGDWNGDGTTDVGVYDSASARFYLKTGNASGNAETVFSFGRAGAGYQPIVGDWNGDGIDTVGLYDPATSRFYLRNSNTGGNADVVFSYGASGAGWLPIAGDWNGDGVTTVGLYDPASSVFFFRNSNSPGYADVSFAYGAPRAGWTPVAGDWNHDGVATIGLYNPATANFYLRNSNSAGYADVSFAYGPAGSGWRPIVGDWDGTVAHAARAAGRTMTAQPQTLGEPDSDSQAIIAVAAVQQSSAAPQAGAGVFSSDDAQHQINRLADYLASLLAEQPATGDGRPSGGSSYAIDPQAFHDSDLLASVARELKETSRLDDLDLATWGGRGGLSEADRMDAACQTDALFAGEPFLDFDPA